MGGTAASALPSANKEIAGAEGGALDNAPAECGQGSSKMDGGVDACPRAAMRTTGVDSRAESTPVCPRIYWRVPAEDPEAEQGVADAPVKAGVLEMLIVKVPVAEAPLKATVRVAASDRSTVPPSPSEMV